METMNIDSREGSRIAELYGVMVYPVILALEDDGHMQQQWEGIEKLPLMNDLAYYSTR
jgi:hypothetical protein